VQLEKNLSFMIFFSGGGNLNPTGRKVKRLLLDGLVKRPDAALRFILRHCGIRKVCLIPYDLRALPAAFLRVRR
jgi:hypothetical protein